MEQVEFMNFGIFAALALPGAIASLIGGGGLPAMLLYGALSITAPLPPATMPAPAIFIAAR